MSAKADNIFFTEKWKKIGAKFMIKHVKCAIIPYILNPYCQ